jgi:hypothetical protein
MGWQSNKNGENYDKKQPKLYQPPPPQVIQLSKTLLTTTLPLSLILTLSLTACGNGSTGGGKPPTPPPADPQTATYTGVTADGAEYTLKITENKGSAASWARYAAKAGDKYELTVGAKKSAGTISGNEGGKLTLKPSNAATVTFTVTVDDSGIIEISGTITWSDNTSVEVTLELTPTGGEGGVYIPEENFTYTTNDDGTLTLQKYEGESMGGRVRIPHMNNGKTVTAIGDNAFANNSKIRSVEIPPTIIEIGQKTFYNCANLTYVMFDIDGINISSDAFAGDLVNKYLSGGAGPYARTAGGSAWTKEDFTYSNIGSFNIKKYYGAGGAVTIPSTIPSTVIALDGYTIDTIGAQASCWCSSITSVTIPNTITRIEHWAFTDCENLTSVTFQGNISADKFGYSAYNSYAVDFGNPFDGDLRDKYLAGGPGTYKTTAPVNENSVWTKQ